MANTEENLFLQLRRALPDRQSQHDVAIKLGLTGSAVASWERYKSAPEVRLLPRLAEVYGVSQQKILEAVLEIVNHQKRQSRLVKAS